MSPGALAGTVTLHCGPSLFSSGPKALQTTVALVSNGACYLRNESRFLHLCGMLLNRRYSTERKELAKKKKGQKGQGSEGDLFISDLEDWK